MKIKPSAFTVVEFAELAKVKPATVREWCRLERITSIRVSKRLIRVPYSEAERLGFV